MPSLTLENREKIKHNLTVCESILDGDPSFTAAYPNLYRIIKRISRYLYDFNKYAIDKVIGERVQQFFVSCRFLADHYGYGSHNTWNRNVNIFCTLGLVKRVPFEHIIIKDELRKPTKGNYFNFYRIPLYTTDRLKKANNTAKKLLDSGFKMNAFNKFFLEKYLGRELANKVYPDERAVTAYSDYVTNEITQCIMRDIEKYGFTTKERVLRLPINMIDMKKVTTQEYGFHRNSRKHILSREFDRSISQICEGYGLIYKKADKELKERYGLDTYQWIIYRP